MSFEKMTGLNIALIGATGGIGHALAKQLSKDNDVQTFSRRGADDIHINITDEDTIKDAARHVSTPLDLVIVATGLLHNNEHLQPEKSIKDLNYEDLISAFAINTIGPSLVAKHFIPLLKRESSAVHLLRSLPVSAAYQITILADGMAIAPPKPLLT
jgi:NAD(P)-dependent dehydrogenase (short-subunit alcohol dehydrogenase family)